MTAHILIDIICLAAGRAPNEQVEPWILEPPHQRSQLTAWVFKDVTVRPAYIWR